jgi:hypothetical protein
MVLRDASAGEFLATPPQAPTRTNRSRPATSETVLVTEAPGLQDEGALLHLGPSVCSRAQYGVRSDFNPADRRGDATGAASSHPNVLNRLPDA